jgi:hypothetical protein
MSEYRLPLRRVHSRMLERARLRRTIHGRVWMGCQTNSWTGLRPEYCLREETRIEY